MTDETIQVFAYVVDAAGKARRLRPQPVDSIVGEPGSNAAMRKARREFESRGYRLRSLAWRVGGGLLVYVLDQRLDPTKPAVKV